MAEHSPTPWRLTGQTIRDAEGGVVMSAINPADMETRRLIVAAVNERDRLRDIMRGLVAILETITLEDHEIELLDEAREALGEEEKQCRR